MRRTAEKRSPQFKWQTKLELYTYFIGKFALSRADVDAEISRTLTEFKPRKGQAVDTRELWQKVGNNLERGAIRTKAEIDSHRASSAHV
jgi:hypothetical protein